MKLQDVKVCNSDSVLANLSSMYVQMHMILSNPNPTLYDQSDRTIIRFQITLPPLPGKGVCVHMRVCMGREEGSIQKQDAATEK